MAQQLARVDTRAFNAMLSRLSKLSGTSYERVIKSEVGKILEATVKFTPALQVQRTRARHDSATFTTQPASIYTPKHSRGSRSGNIKYCLGNRYPDVLWSAISTRRKQRLLKILGARGLSKKSWWKIAQKLGIQIAVPGFVTKATASTGRDYDDVDAKSVSSRRSAGVTISNAQPTANLDRVGGGRALKRAIAGRVKFFQENVRREVFKDVKQIARAYPGMKVSA